MRIPGLLELCFGRLTRLDGETVPFEDPRPDLPLVRTDPDVVSVEPTSEPPAPVPPSSGAPAADLTGFTDKPGAGQHHNDCVFLDDPKHICEDWHGHATNRMCRASIYHRQAVDFEARHPHLTPRAPGCRFTDDPWHRCVNESGQTSSLVCHATHTRRTPAVVEPEMVVW